MKMILKNGSEIEIDSLNYNYNYRSNENKSSYTISIKCKNNNLQDQLNDLEKSFTEDNISNVKFVTEETDANPKIELEYCFTEVVSLHMIVNDSRQSINAQFLV